MKEREKFLGIFSGKDLLLKLEWLLRTDLGVYKNRWNRPFIGKYEKGYYLLLFLTTRSYSKFVIDLKVCDRGGESICKSLEAKCFPLRDRNRGEVLVYAVHEERFRNFSFLFCGLCEDLELMDRLRREYFG